jgi:hypothetical protein
MKYFFNILLLFFIITTSLFSDEKIESKELYLEYSSYPKRVFTGQKFEIKLKSLIFKDLNSYDSIVTTFTQEENIERLTKDIIWIKNESSEYTTTIIYKVFKKAFILPKITLSLSQNEEIIDFISINSPNIKYEKIAVNQKLFSNIIAKDLEVFTAKTKQYTNNILHTTINIRAKNSNLEDFRLNAYGDDQAINSLTNLSSTQNLYYYVMIPSHITEIKFNYYNTITKDFVMITIPIILDEELISTQTELNPYNSSILIYKEVFSGLLLLVSILLYIYRRDNIYLIFMTIFIVILTYLFIPNKNILLQKDSKVYILPTNNSTIFKTLNSKYIVEIINETKDFVKVLFENESIGWIKKNDI